MPDAPRLKFLVDEDLHRGIAQFLQAQGHDVLFVPKGVKNGSVFALAVRTKRTLVSGDKDFLDTTLFPPNKTTGVIVIRTHPPSPANIIPLLETLLRTVPQKTLRGRLVVLEPSGIRIP